MAAITSLDDIIAGAQQPRSFSKTTGTLEASGVYHSTFYNNGMPGPGVAPSAGVNGAAITAPLNGCIPRNNPTGGAEAFLGRFVANGSNIGSLILCDRLWANSGLSMTSTTAQAITPAALPARDDFGTTDGEGVYAGIEHSAPGGANTPTVTLTFTDSDGNTGRTASFVGNTTPVAGTMEIFDFLQAGVKGVRAPTSFIQSQTRNSGAQHLVLFRMLAILDMTTQGGGRSIDALEGLLPQIYDDSALFFLWLPNSNAVMSVRGQIIEVHK